MQVQILRRQLFKIININIFTSWKESLIGKTKEDIILKDPCQHLTFTTSSKAGSIKFWLKHEKLNENQQVSDLKSLIVASVSYTTFQNLGNVNLKAICSKRVELKLPLVTPFQIGSKCCSTSFRPMISTPPRNQDNGYFFIKSLI